MQIVNFIKDSTIECAPFSWGLTLFSFGCNLHCKMCEGYNYEIVTNKNNIKGDAVSIIRENTTPLHDCVVFIGGEPTIWGEKLFQALEYCHSIGLKTKVFSNGVLHDVIKQINERKLCDAWSIDFKGLRNLKEQINLEDNGYLECVNSSIEDIISNNLPLEIRTTFHAGNEHERNEVKDLVNKKYVEPYKKENPTLYISYIEQEDVRSLV